MGRSLENVKEQTLVQIMNSKNIVNNVGICRDITAMNSIFSEQYWDEH